MISNPSNHRMLTDVNKRIVCHNCNGARCVTSSTPNGPKLLYCPVCHKHTEHTIHDLPHQRVLDLARSVTHLTRSMLPKNGN